MQPAEPRFESRNTKYEVNNKQEALHNHAVLKIETTTQQNSSSTSKHITQTFNEPAPNFKTQTENYPSQPRNTLPETGSKKSLLDILRQKAGDKYTVEEIREAIPLTPEKLNVHIDEYIATIEKAGGKSSTVNTFKMSRLEIENDIFFKFYVSTITGQRAIEQEKMMLTDLLHQHFNNPAITFGVEVEESTEEVITPVTVLNSKQRFELIASQYPLVKVLKERLKLDLDY